MGRGAWGVAITHKHICGCLPESSLDSGLLFADQTFPETLREITTHFIPSLIKRKSCISLSVVRTIVGSFWC